MVTSSKNPGKLVPLYKIIINNGGTKRVRAVFWGRDAEKNSPIIHDRTVSIFLFFFFFSYIVIRLMYLLKF